MTIKIIRKKKLPKSNVYEKDGIEMSFHSNREEFIRLWNERRITELFNRIPEQRRTPRFID